ncbi:hypothetical protein Pcinc_038019 [Petrolisthes cinctipes]|uniref:Uncharacterized protein n=1 Tax=Petrolisthes cinctipes TaxID=88211 RepID=A0AAE1BRH5_PETCI|nr:hypothetical protein Pcinc_038019 [Petrolisthes cinctipes]
MILIAVSGGSAGAVRYEYGWTIYRNDTNNNNNNIQFPRILQGDWYSWEEGSDVETEIRRDEVRGLGRPVSSVVVRRDTFHYVFVHHVSRCYFCSRFIVRSWNIVERLDGVCVSLREGSAEDVAREACRGLEEEFGRNGVIMFREDDPAPLICRPALYGLYHFAWQNTFSSTGECNHPGARVRACQEPGSQFLVEGQHFTLHYRSCPGITDSYDAKVVYSCLGDWYMGRNQYFAVANTKESRKDKKYRCFVRSRDDDLYLGHSITPQCSVLKTPDNSPVRLRLTPAQSEALNPGCFLPHNVTGQWQATGLGEALVKINSTHLLETTTRGYSTRTAAHVCMEQRGNRYLMARLSSEGCQTEYVCWEFLPRHHNIVRYRISRALLYSDFQVCDYSNFRSGQSWKYDTLIADNPNPISCPFGGRFTFGQSGGSPLTPRVVGGVTSSPLDTYRCKRRLTNLAVCGGGRKWMVVDLDLCDSLNKDGHPDDFNSVTDYQLQCVGFWKENLLSYLVTHDPSDSVSRFRCWVYQRMGPTDLRLSQSVGAACGLRQTFLSSSYQESAAVALNLTLNERLHDYCPLYYDDGSNPWKEEDQAVTVFRFSRANPSVLNLHPSLIICLTLLLMAGGIQAVSYIMVL